MRLRHLSLFSRGSYFDFFCIAWLHKKVCFKCYASIVGIKEPNYPNEFLRINYVLSSLQPLRRIPYSFASSPPSWPARRCSTNYSLLWIANLCLCWLLAHKSSLLYLLSSLRLPLTPLFIYSKLTDSSTPSSIVSFLSGEHKSKPLIWSFVPMILELQVCSSGPLTDYASGGQSLVLIHFCSKRD